MFNLSNPFAAAVEESLLLDQFMLDLPDLRDGTLGRWIGQSRGAAMPEVEDFLGQMRPAINEVLAVYVDHDCDGTVTTYRLFPGTCAATDADWDDPRWNFSCGTLTEVREATADEARAIRRDGFAMPEYIVVRDENWFPWVEDESRGIPALDHTLDDDLSIY